MNWILGLIESIWLWLIGLPRDLFGERMDSGWGIAASIYVSVVAVAFLIGGYRSIHELIKAIDIRFNKDTLHNYNLHREDGTDPRIIDWIRARKQQVRSLRFTIPFGLIVLGVLYWWTREYFTLLTYFKIVAGWLIASPLLRVWWIATVVWTHRKLAKKESSLPANRRPLSNKTVRWAVAHYMRWGLEKSAKKRAPFIGLLRFLNPIIKFFRLRWLQPRLIRPLAICTFHAFIWPVSMVWATFYLTREFEERSEPLKPEWSSRYAKEPEYGPGGISDTDGDAQAARS